MELRGRVAVVTGAAAGIGRALCLRFAREGLAGLVAVDIDGAGAEAVARECGGGIGLRADVAVEAELRAAVDSAGGRFGRVDVFCSNAGIFVPSDERTTLDSDWEGVWGVNVKADVYAGRAVLPAMLERGEGYLLQTRRPRSGSAAQRVGADRRIQAVCAWPSRCGRQGVAGNSTPLRHLHSQRGVR